MLYVQLYFDVNNCTRWKGIENEPQNVNHMHVYESITCKLREIIFGIANRKK